MRPKLITVTCLLFLIPATNLEPSTAMAQLSDADILSIIDNARTHFWGHAIGEDGELLEPANEEERTSLLIPEGEAKRIVADAVLYGLAVWCDVEWKPQYAAYMRTERAKKWSEKQIAFIGLLFGTTQGTISKSIKVACDESDKRRVLAGLQQEAERLRDILERAHRDG